MGSNLSKKMIDEFLNFGDELIQMKNIDSPIEFVPSYLGNISAEKEWEDSPEEAYKKFLNTKSYADFVHEDALILLGRTGTGKTAILRCLHENINKRKVDAYDGSVIISFDDILGDLLKVADDFNSPAIMGQLRRSISMYINCHVMKYLVDHGTLVSSSMSSYLKNNDLYDFLDYEPSKAGFSKIQRMLRTSAKLSGKAGNIANDMVVISDIISAFAQSGYEEALYEMRHELTNKKILVLIDTLNEYDMRDLKLTVCVKALISTCFEYYTAISKNHILVKISIPSEIHTQIIEQLPGKQQGNAVVIQWKNNDLIKMIAMRLLYYYEKSGGKTLHFFNTYHYKDFYDDNPNSVANAKKMLHELLPNVCPTSLNYAFDTLAYCIRHTLKKPRELLVIFNYFLLKISQEEDSSFFIKHPDEIRNVIHSTQEEMITSALSMYTTSYKDILRVCEIVLHNQRYYFQGVELGDRLKEAAVNRTYDIDDIKRILLESGLIGKINDISRRRVKDDDTQNLTINNSIQIVKAKFEYQIKGRLFLNKDDWFVLHPMCYEHFSCLVGNQTLVHPGDLDGYEAIQSVRLKPGNKIEH